MTPQNELHAQTNDRNNLLLSELRDRIAAAGCFAPAPRAYVIRIVLISLVYSAAFGGLLITSNGTIRLCLLVVVAFATVQAGFIAHDVGDGAVTQNRKLAVLLRHFLMSFISALSSSYFNHVHRAHHIRLHRGLGAAGHQLANVNPFEVHWLKRVFAWNGVVFAIATICLRGLTFKLESIRYVTQNWKTTRQDRVMMVLHAIVWLVIPIPVIGIANTALNYACVVLFGGLYIGTVLVLNHEGMSKVDGLGRLSLLDRTLASTRNLGQSWLSNVLLGGVNNHVEHHLFPQVPVVRLADARRIAESFWGEKGLSYTSTSCMSALASAFRYFCSITPETRVTQALS